jgi:signal peptidase II
MMVARGLAVAILVAIADQLSKAAVLAYFARHVVGGRIVRVTPFFDLVLTYNRGMSFGLFSGGEGVNAVLFSLAAAAIVAVLIFWLSRAQTRLLGISIGLIIGGAVGNVVDRLRHGAVVDFLYFHAGSWYWPAFNLADSAICIGVAAMLLEGTLLRRQVH